MSCFLALGLTMSSLLVSYVYLQDMLIRAGGNLKYLIVEFLGFHVRKLFACQIIKICILRQ